MGYDSTTLQTAQDIGREMSNAMDTVQQAPRTYCDLCCGWFLSIFRKN